MFSFILSQDAFSGCQILPCSHKVHRDCAIAMIQNGVYVMKYSANFDCVQLSHENLLPFCQLWDSKYHHQPPSSYFNRCNGDYWEVEYLSLRYLFIYLFADANVQSVDILFTELPQMMQTRMTSCERGDESIDFIFINYIYIGHSRKCRKQEWKGTIRIRPKFMFHRPWNTEKIVKCTSIFWCL